MTNSADQNLQIETLRPFLLEAEISRDIAPDRVYRNAGIGALTLLNEQLEANDPDAAALLIDTFRLAPAEPFRKRAFMILEKSAVSGNPLAIDALFSLALDYQSETALNTLRERKITSANPAREAAKFLMIGDRKRLLKSDSALAALTRAFLDGNDALRAALLNRAEKALSGWGVLMAWLIDPAEPESRRRLVSALTTFSAEERRCFFSVMNEFPEAGRPVMADAWLRYDDAELRRLCEAHDAQPSDPEDTAVYYYLIEDWARYRENDLDYRAVLRVFDGPDKLLQLRLIAVATRTGGEWLSALNPDDRLTTAKAEFGFTDWAEQIRSAAERNDLSRLWSLAQIAPLALVPAALDALFDNGFTPNEGEETALFHRLRNYLTTNPPPYPPTLHASAHHIAGAPLDFQLSADGRLLTLIGASGKIVVLSRDALTAPLLNFRLSGCLPRKAKLSRDGTRLVSVWSDRSVRVFDLRGGGLVHQFAIPGAETVNFWLKSDGRRMILLGNDGTIRELSFPTGVELSREAVSFGSLVVFGAYDDERNRVLTIDKNGSAILIDLNRRLPLSRFNCMTPIRAVAETIDQDRLICVTDERLDVTHCPSGNSLLTENPNLSGLEQLRGAAFVPGCGCVMTFGSDGSVFAYAVPGGEPLGRFGLPVPSCDTARIDADGQFLYVVSDDGCLYQFALADFRFALLPVERIELVDLDAPRLSGALRDLQRERIDWDRRFEIDLDLDFE